MRTLKRTIFLLAFSFLLAGCAAKYTRIDSLEQDAETVAGVGDVFFNHKEGTGFEGGTEPFLRDAFSFELTILEVSAQKIGLQYTEYTKVKERSENPYTFATTSDWIIKKGFNKQLEYDISGRFIRFKGYEFFVIATDGGHIRYRRIR